jgi:peptidyl-prolyl cis-trans isomerase SurA
MPKITNEEITRGINKLDSVRSRIIAGVLTFNEAVARYTEAETKSTAGMRLYYDGSTYLPIAELDKDLVVLLDQSKLQPGQYSKPAAFTDATGKQGVRLIFFKSRTIPHRQNLKDDYDRIAEEALTIKKEQAMDAWLSAKIPSYYLMIDPEYSNCSMLNKWTQKSATANR